MVCLYIDAAIIAHGSHMDLPMTERIVRPALFVCPEHDSQVDSKFRGEIEQASCSYIYQQRFIARLALQAMVEKTFTCRRASPSMYKLRTVIAGDAEGGLPELVV